MGWRLSAFPGRGARVPEHPFERKETVMTGTPEKDPGDWTTGEESMTGPQESYLHTLAREAGENVPDDLTKAEASRLIDRLQQETGRGA
jgi:hypothetical protein